MSRHEFDDLKIAAAGIFFGAMLVRSGYARLKKLRRIQDTPTANIATAPQGAVEFQGFTWASLLIPDPCSQSPCVFYDFRIEEERGTNKNRSWVEIFRDMTEHPFVLFDETGFCRILPAQSENFEIAERVLYPRNITETQQSSLTSFLRSKGSDIQVHRGWFSRNIRYRLKVLTVGAPALVAGHFQTGAEMPNSPLPLPGLQEFYIKIQSLHKNRLQRALTPSQIPPLAHQVLRTHSSRVSASGATALKYLKGLPEECFGVVVHTQEAPLLIADCHERDLLKSLGRFNYTRLYGGCLLLAAGLAYIIYRLHPL